MLMTSLTRTPVPWTATSSYKVHCSGEEIWGPLPSADGTLGYLPASNCPVLLEGSCALQRSPGIWECGPGLRGLSLFVGYSVVGTLCLGSPERARETKRPMVWPGYLLWQKFCIYERHVATSQATR